MFYSGTDFEALLIRTTVVSAALQALVGRLMADGALDQGDVISMREAGLQLAADWAEQPGCGEAGRRMAGEVDTWWDAALALGGG